MLNVSASRDKAGRLHVSLCNLDPMRPAEIQCEIKGTKATEVSGRVLTSAAINTHNTFDNPTAVKPQPFQDARITEAGFSATLPPKSVVVLQLK